MVDGCEWRRYRTLTILKVFWIDRCSFCIGHHDIINVQPKFIGYVIMTDGNGARSAEITQVVCIWYKWHHRGNVISQFPPNIVLQHIAIERSIPTQRSIRWSRDACKFCRFGTDFCCSKADGFRPVTNVFIIYIGTNHYRVRSVIHQACQREGIAFGKNQILHIVIHT